MKILHLRTLTPAIGEQDRGAGHHQIGTVGTDARFGGAFLDLQRAQPGGDRIALIAGHPQAIDPRTIIARQPQVQACQAGDGA